MPLGGEGVGKARARILMEAVMVKNLPGEDWDDRRTHRRRGGCRPRNLENQEERGRKVIH